VRQPRANSAPGARGFTFLEAVLAAALLGIIAAAILSAIGYAWNAEIRGRQQLGAAEVANRVLISYLDDQTSLRKLPRVIDYDGRSFRWNAELREVRLVDDNPSARRDRRGETTANAAFDRLVSVRVLAWLDDGSAASLAPGATPSATIERLVDPLAFRGADTIERIFDDPERQRELLRGLVDLPSGNPR
jgi:type II secretory pathway pseudopilin PulG